MLSNRPYLLRAFYQWIIDSACTPVLVVDATQANCQVPENYIEGGEIVFNVSPNSVRDLVISNDKIDFKASFSSIIHFVSVPIQSIIAIYADENGEGLYFDGEEEVGDGGEVGANSFIAVREKETSIPMMSTGKEQELNKSKPYLKLVE